MCKVVCLIEIKQKKKAEELYFMSGKTRKIGIYMAGNHKSTHGKQFHFSGCVGSISEDRISFI